MSATVRISKSAHQALRELSETERVPMLTLLDRAIESYKRQRILEATNRAYAALRVNPDAWKQELKERNLWDATLADGLDDE